MRTKKVNGRNKGKVAEREVICVLSGLFESPPEMKRNLEQTREGGHDITGVDGWAIEVKRYKKATPALISGWWEQAVDQAKGTERRPALFYREDHGQWRVVVYLDMIYPNLDLSVFPQEMDKTVEMSPSTWVRLVETKELRLIVR